MSSRPRGPLSVLAAARDAAGRAALASPGGALSWEALRDAVRDEARRLADGDSGLVDDSGHVEVVAGSETSDIIRLLTAIETGRTAVLLHPAWTAPERERARALVRASGALTGAAATGPAPDAETPLAVAFTSGTAAGPVPIVLSRRAFLASARASAERLGWRDDEKWLLCLPTAHVGGLSILTRTLIARRTVHALPRFEPDAVRHAIDAERVTLVSMVPTMLSRLLADFPHWSPPATLRAVLLGGAPARASLLRASRERGVPVLMTYGMTETCSQVATQDPGTAPGPEQGAGRPLRGVGLEIARDGEIMVSGPTLLSRRLGDDGPLFDGAGRFATGDRGRFDDAGRLHVEGRVSDVIISGGENVAPGEVEQVVGRCPGIRDVLVFGIADPDRGEIVAAAVTPDSVNGPDLVALRRLLARELAPFKRPRRIAIVTELPTTPAGKPDRRRAAETLASRLRPLGD